MSGHRGPRLDPDVLGGVAIAAAVGFLFWLFLILTGWRTHG